MIVHYKYILTADLPRYEAEGWRFVCHLRPLGGWEQVLVERDALDTQKQE